MMCLNAGRDVCWCAPGHGGSKLHAGWEAGGRARQDGHNRRAHTSAAQEAAAAKRGCQGAQGCSGTGMTQTTSIGAQGTGPRRGG